MVAKRLFYGAWAFGVVGLALAGVNHQIGGALLLPTGLLLLATAHADIGSQVPSQTAANPRFLNFIVVCLGLIWLVIALVLLI